MLLTSSLLLHIPVPELLFHSGFVITEWRVRILDLLLVDVEILIHHSQCIVVLKFILIQEDADFFHRLILQYLLNFLCLLHKHQVLWTLVPLGHGSEMRDLLIQLHREMEGHLLPEEEIFL